MSPNRNLVISVVTAAALVAFFLLSSPVPQDPAYHQFADGRTLLGVSNFWNVMSNLPLMVIGLWGTLIVFRHHNIVCLPGLELAYIVFFTGILLTAFGSAYYHLNPANDPLVWDRLPMTIGFAGLFSVILGEFVSKRIGRTILIPLLLIGIASVEYWAYTETNGQGDLRPYVVVQFLPMILVPAILLTYKPAIGSAKYFWYMLLFLCARQAVRVHRQRTLCGQWRHQWTFAETCLCSHGSSNGFVCIDEKTTCHARRE